MQAKWGGKLWHASCVVLMWMRGGTSVPHVIVLDQVDTPPRTSCVAMPCWSGGKLVLAILCISRASVSAAGITDAGIDLKFTQLQRKWTMASVDPEVCICLSVCL